jgi:archaetidylinositol phosphate synthase
MSAPPAFRESKRELKSLLAGPEKKALVWLAGRMPAGVSSDHLTGLGFAAMGAACLFYALSRSQPLWLHAVNAALVVNWFGDSLDGTLARVRQRLRPRYGFYVDHIVDMFGALFLLGGLVLSGHMSAWVGAALLIAYYMLHIHIYLATYTMGVFKISFGLVGGTELRLLVMASNLTLLFAPGFRVGGWALFDAAGLAATAGLLVTTVVSTVKATRTLYDLERLD